MTPPAWHHSHAAIDGQHTRGWFVGHFIDLDAGVRHTADVELKWGVHPAGETRTEWAADPARTTLSVLVSGHFSVYLDDGTTEAPANAELTRQGDYVIFGPGINHTWRAHADTVILTVRWPSLRT